MTLRASSLGRTAHRLLAPGAQLIVRQVFRTAIHAIDAQGELLVITSDSTRAPWVLNVPGLIASWAAPGDTMMVSGDQLHGPGQLNKPLLITASIWSPTALGPPAKLIQIEQCVAELDLPDAAPGLADIPTNLLIKLQLVLAAGPNHDDKLAHAMMPLIGLGRGLTPAGDDLLTGLLGLLVLAGHTHIPCDAANRTTLPGAIQLAHALRGELPEPLHEVIRFLLLAQREQANSAIGKLAQLGSSSGRDMLAGVRLGSTALLTGWYQGQLS